MKKLLLVTLIAAAAVACGQETPRYKDPSQPVEVRVKDLLGRMTLEEKVAQMQDLSFKDFAVDGVVDTALMDSVLKGMSYCSVFGGKISAMQYAANIAALSDYMEKHNRLGIPIIGEAEGLHGVIQDGATIFPQSVALGSTFDPELVGRVADVIAAEAKAMGINQILSPVLDLARELRWGRVEETYGEDPYLAGAMGAAYVKAFEKHNVICTPKHFIAHGSPSGGLNLASVAGGERELRSIYLKPFAAIFAQAHPWSVMNSYNSYNAVPIAADKSVMTDLLRGELGFKGYVTSDWGSVDMLRHFHGVARDKAEAAQKAVLAGIDCEVDGDCYALLDSMVRAGALSERDIDLCVGRILRAKFATGMFDSKYTYDPDSVQKSLHTEQAVQIALEAARESIVLVKNENDLLPLDVTGLRSVAVIGPNAAQVQFGDYMWTNDNKYGITPLQGIEQFTAGKVKINYARGCDIHSRNRDGFQQAVQAARISDIALLFVGASSGAPGRPYPNSVSGESFDLSDLVLTGVQQQLIEQVAATGTPVVVILVAGKPSAMPWVKDNIPAVVVQWYGGEQQGRAIAEVLFGQVNPSGKLNVSFPKSVGHLPVYYNYYPTDKGFYNIRGTVDSPGRDYVFSDPFPVWAFGHGLSYTTFEYKDIRVSDDSFALDGVCHIEVDLHNSGAREGKEVVQLYVRDLVGSVVRPVKELVRFEKVLVKAGETRTVHFELPVSELGLWNTDMEYVVEAGDFELQIGTASDNILLRKTISVKE